MASEKDPNVRPWIILVVDDDDEVHSITRLALRRARFFGLPVELRTARSRAEAEEQCQDYDPERFALALVDVVMETDHAGLELVETLRQRYGTTLQIILRTGQPGVISPEEVTSKYEISNYLSKQDATPERLRTMISLGVRNFRLSSAMRVLCESLADITALFEMATTKDHVSQILNRALVQYASVWQFEYGFVEDIDSDYEVAFPWQEPAFERIRARTLRGETAEFGRLLEDGESEVWGVAIKPLAGRFTGGFVLKQFGAPSFLLLRELQTLLRAWALAREAVELKQIALDEERVRDEMHRERRESIAQMVAGVAHEVNTPLGVANAAAANLADLILQGELKELREKGGLSEDLEDELTDIVESVELIRRNIRRADELISSFKQLSVRHLVDQREDVDLKQCVEQVVKLYSPKAKQAKLDVVITDNLAEGCRQWTGFPGHLSQVLMNFISNAERYAYKGEPGKLDIVLSSQMVNDRAQFKMVVRDYGAGIPPESVPLVFEAFFTTGRGKGGSGLGMAIVHNIVTQVFGGEIKCESTVGVGTTFTLQFSHSKQEKPTTIAAGKAGEDGPSPNDRIATFHEFVMLQQKLLRNETLSADQQLRLAEVHGAVNKYLEVEFRGHEGRRAPRVPVKRPVDVKLGDQWAQVEMKDISTLGMMLILPAAPEEEPLPLRLGDDPEIHLTGRIKNQTKIDLETGETAWRAGVEFEALAEQDTRKLKTLIATYLLQTWG